MHAPLTSAPRQVQRKCDCTGGGCACPDKKKVQRKARVSEPGDLFEAEADHFADEAMRGGGLAGFDFGRVRVHDDARAHALADARHARAFTYGEDIYFARGERSAPDGQWLLAHELAHTMQQGAASTVRRKEKEEAKDTCTAEQRIDLIAARVRGHSWVEHALRRIDAYRKNPQAAANADVSEALRSHFSAAEPYVSELRNRLMTLRDALVNRMAANDPADRYPIVCQPADFITCRRGPPAAADRTGMDVCPSAFGFNETHFTLLFLHEAAHAFVTDLGGTKTVTDRAYKSDRLYRFLTPEEAFDNAESYAVFVTDLATGTKIKVSRPADEISDCGPRATDIERAIARAQRVSGHVRRMVSGTTGKDFETRYQSQFPGARKPSREEVLKVFVNVDNRIRQPFTIECETSCGGGPGTTGYFRHFLGDVYALHVCPGFFTVPDERRTIETYRMLLQYTEIFNDAESRPYVAIAESIATDDKPAARLAIRDTRPRVLPEDEAAYGDVVALVARVQTSVGKKQGRMPHLVRKLAGTLSGREIVVRFHKTPGAPPRYDADSNVLLLPPRGTMPDAQLMLDLFRETTRMERDVTASEAEFTTPVEGETSEKREAQEKSLVQAQGDLVPEMKAAGIDVAAADANIAAGAAREQASIAVPPSLTFRVHIQAGGDAILVGKSREIPLGNIPRALWQREFVERWLDGAIRSRADAERKAAFGAGHTRLHFRAYQYGEEVAEVVQTS